MKQSLEDRMKEYEQGTCSSLPENIPIILRLDGRAFHTITRNLQKPFDLTFIHMMNTIAIDLCDNEIQNARMAYLQSDEISILIYKGVMSGSWFKNDVQKMTSISASRASCIATEFNLRKNLFGEHAKPMFDSRVFLVPEKDVCNYFIWRQRDFERNSLQMVARQYYSQKQLNKKSCSDMHEMIFQKGLNWNKLPAQLRRGRCVVPKIEKVYVTKEETKGHFEGLVDRTTWVVNNQIPIFTKDRNHINKFLEVDKE
jgi:tRNA(His) guanylyltransferase